MKVFFEKEAEDFLERESFDVVKRDFSSRKSNLLESLKKVGFPFIMKACGKKLSKRSFSEKIDSDVKNYSQALEKFDKLKKIKNSQGVLIQKKIYGKEFFIGLKKVQEFGHAIFFGSKTYDDILKKEISDVSFRICPIEKKDIKIMIKEIKSSKKLLKKEGEKIERIILKLCRLSKKYPNILNLKINSLIINEEVSKIVDAKIIFR